MPDSVFLFTGPEIGERSDAVASLRTKTEKKNGQLDVYTFYAAETSVSEIVSLLLNGSLFASARFVVVHNAELIKKKEDIELLSEWKRSADDGSVLILVSDEISVDKKLDSLVPKENKKIFWELFQDRKKQWLFSFFQRAGFRITDDAVELILELIENNTEALKRECSRFFVCFEKNHEITAEDAENLLAHNKEESAFSLFDSLTQPLPPDARLSGALDILQKLRLSKDGSFVPLIAGVTYCFRRLAAWHRLAARGAASPFDLKINGFSSKKAQEQYKRAARIWNEIDTASILALLAGTDTAIRTSGSLCEEIQLQLLLYAIVMKKGRPLAAYISDSA